MAEDDGTIYMPSKSEYIFTGTVGICVYSLILYLSIASAWVGFKSKSTRRFFGSIGIMALLELPRYFDMAVDGTYNSRVCYSFHIVAGVFFFLAFSIVCRQWSGLLQLGSYFRMVYGYNGLVISNVSFAIADFIAIIFCLTSRSLDGFFFSMAFVVITFIEGLRNCVYSGFLSYYGLKLVRRFWHFSRLERRVSSRYCCCYVADDQVFTRVVLRLTSVLVLTTLCFLCRMTMLVAKMAELHSPKELTTPAFTLFGFWWFVFSDFLPRALPSLAFIFLMRTKRPARDQVHNGLHPTDRSQDRNTFQFVRLEASGGKGRGADRESGEGRRGRGGRGGGGGGGGDDDDDDDYDDRRDDFPRSYSFSGYSDDGVAEIHFQHPHDGDDDDATKSILHHDRFVSDDAPHRPVSTEGFSLVSFRDLTRGASSPTASMSHPHAASSSTIHRLESLHYLSDDEADYETVVAAGDDEDDDEDADGDTAGDKAIDSLLNLLSFTATGGGGTSKAASVGGGAQSRSGSYSGDAVAVAAGLAGPASGGGGGGSGSGFTPSPSTSLPYHSSLSAASLAAHVPSSQSHRTDSSAPSGGDGSIVAAMSSSSPATRSGPRGLGAAIQRMREQQQQPQPQPQSPLQLPPPPPPPAHTIEMHPDDSERDEQDALV